MTSEVEQPAGDRPPRAPMGGQMAWWPFLVALLGVVGLVVAVVLINAFAGGGTTGSRQQGTALLSNGAVACPTYFEHVQPVGGQGEPWVPAKPAGLGAKDKLVPSLHPTHVTVCEYLNRSTGTPRSLRLSGQHVLSGNLDRVVDTLRPARKATDATGRSCGTRPSAALYDNYLIALRYAEAIVWVSTPGDGCIGSSNGTFHSDVNFASDARASYTAGTWVGSRP